MADAERGVINLHKLKGIADRGWKLVQLHGTIDNASNFASRSPSSPSSVKFYTEMNYELIIERFSRFAFIPTRMSCIFIIYYEQQLYLTISFFISTEKSLEISLVDIRLMEILFKISHINIRTMAPEKFEFDAVDFARKIVSYSSFQHKTKELSQLFRVKIFKFQYCILACHESFAYPLVAFS